MTTPRGSAVLLDGQLPALASEISARLIMTRTDQIVSVTPGASIAEAVAKLGSAFDQLPVLVDGKLHGMLFRRHIPDDPPSAAPISTLVCSTSELSSVRAREGILDVITQVKDHEVCVVFDQTNGQFCGLIHFSDLNRQAARVFCYLWTSALEMAMAELLQSSIPHHNDWIGSLSQHRQVQVLGRYEYGRRQNIELSAVEGLELSDFINIWPRHEQLLAVLGLTKSQFKSKANHLVDLRNAAMHPVRSLVNRHGDAATLAARLNDVQLLVERATDALRRVKSESGIVYR